MKNQNPSGRNLAFASAGQRLLSLFVFVVLAYLIWAAYSGRYDREVGRVAAWLHRHFDAVPR